MVAIAGSRPRSRPIDLVVGDGDAVAGIVTKNNVLAADQRGSDVIDPYQIDVVNGDGVTAPDVLGVEVRDVDVLDDDVFDTGDKAQALALDDALAADTNNGLVGLDVDAQRGRLVVGDRHLGGVGLVVGAPVVLVDSRLAARGSAIRRTTGLGGSALGTSEVKRLLEVDDPRRRIGQVGHQLGVRLGHHRRRGAASGDTLGKALSSSRDGGGRPRQEGGCRGPEEWPDMHLGGSVAFRSSTCSVLITTEKSNETKCFPAHYLFIFCFLSEPKSLPAGPRPSAKIVKGATFASLAESWKHTIGPFILSSAPQKCRGTHPSLDDSWECLPESGLGGPGLVENGVMGRGAKADLD